MKFKDFDKKVSLDKTNEHRRILVNRILILRNEIARTGITFGAALAIAISWSTNKSILWAILHGVLSWLYVIYYAIKSA